MRHDLIADLAAEADALSKVGNHVASAATWRVAADVAEEDGAEAFAYDLRGVARKELVVLWTRRRWPHEGILGKDVMTLVEGGRFVRGRWIFPEQYRFMIRRPHRDRPPTPGFTTVRIDSRGRVRILEET